ncbi:MAG: glycosyltransferase family 39 protein, partial [Anaerolineae bacterium]|jgi:hypothetical protein
VALGLRLVRLSFQPLWWDEGWSLFFATIDPGSMLERTAVDIHPPLYYLLLNLWLKLCGTSAGSARLLSVFLGTATVPLLYAMGRRMLGPRSGLAAAFLLAISPLHIYYSQEVRMYVLVTLLGLAATYFARQWNPGRWAGGIWLGYVLAATAALYTQYYAGFLLLALNLVILIRWLRRRKVGSLPAAPVRGLGSWLGAQVAVFLLFLPWLWYASGKLLSYVRFKVSVEQDPSLGLFTYLARHLAAFTWGHAEGLLAGWWWVGLLPPLALALALGLVLWWRSRSKAAGSRGPGNLADWELGGPSFLILAVALLCGFVVNLLFPFNPPRSERLLLLALPVYLLLVTAGLLILRRYRRPLAVASAASFVVLAIVSLSFLYTVPRYPDDDYRPLVARVRALGLPGDAVIAIHPWQVGYFQAYIPDDEARPALVLTPREVIPAERQIWADEPARMADELDALLAGHGRLWLLDHRAMGRVLEKQIEASLVEQAYPVLSEWYGENTVLSLFAGGAPVAQPVTARFADWLALEGAALDPGPLEAGWGTVSVDLVWQVSEQPAEDYTVGLSLSGPTGHVWAQRDTPPGGGRDPFSEWSPGEPHSDRHGLLVPAGTPPGDYQLTLRVYRSPDVSVLPATFEGGSGGEVSLGTVRVVRPGASLPPEALAFEQSLGVDFTDRLRLLGYNAGTDAALLPGEVVEVVLFWQALADPGEDFLLRLQLLDTEGQALAELTEKPVAGTYPTAWWQAGELVRDPHDLPIPATVPPGRYRLALSLVRVADGQPVEVDGRETTLELGEVEVLGREHRSEPTAPGHQQEAQLGASVALTGYDLPRAAHTPGSPLEVTLHWRVLDTPDQNYHTFVHLLDADDGIAAQADGPPAGGELPTLGWLPGEYLTDTHRLQLPFDLPAGKYRLGVGFYDPTTGLRLGERVILDERIAVP